MSKLTDLLKKLTPSQFEDLIVFVPNEQSDVMIGVVASISGNVLAKPLISALGNLLQKLGINCKVQPELELITVQLYQLFTMEPEKKYTTIQDQTTKAFILEAKKIISAQLKDSGNILGTRKSELEAQLNSAQDVLMIIIIAMDVQQAIEQAKAPPYIAPAPAKPKEENQAEHLDESLQILLQNAFQKDIRVSVFTYNDMTKVNLSTSNQTKASILTNFLPKIVGIKYEITQNNDYGINFMIMNPELLLDYVLDNEHRVKEVFSGAAPGDTSLPGPGPYTYPSL